MVIDENNEFVMKLIANSFDELVEKTDYYYGDKNKMKKTLGEGISGLIIIRQHRNDEYYIDGLIVYKPKPIPGQRCIVLLYGTNVILRRNLVISLMNYLDDTVHKEFLEDFNTENKLIVQAYSYDSEDSYIYIDLGFKFIDATQKPDGSVLSVLYEYRY